MCLTVPGLVRGTMMAPGGPNGLMQPGIVILRTLPSVSQRSEVGQG